MSRWSWLFRELRSRIWFRAAAISALAIVFALGGALLAPFIPYELSVSVGGDAVDTILSVLASSMLAVTTFSLTAMVTAFSGASQQITPRAVHLLIEDRTAQNALSTFLGGFVYSLVSIVALTTGIYGAQGRVILFAGTIVVAVVIVLTLLRWIARLVNFGRVDDAISMIEKKTIAALADFPGPILMTDAAETALPDASYRDRRTGYLVHVDRGALSQFAQDADVRIEMRVAPGHFIDPTVILAGVSRALSEPECERFANALTVSRQRDFDQDPRFGMQVLAEIAMRALSPAVNDPGTAVQVLVAGQRALANLETSRIASDPLPNLSDAPLFFDELVEILTLPIARDGAAFAEVGAQLQQMLGTLDAQLVERVNYLRALALDAVERSRASAMSVLDMERIAEAHKSAFR